MYKDGVEVYNTSSSSSAAAAASDAVPTASCVVGDKLSCGVTFDNDKQLTVYFIKNNHKVPAVILLLVIIVKKLSSLQRLGGDIRHLAGLKQQIITKDDITCAAHRLNVTVLSLNDSTKIRPRDTFQTPLT